VVALIVFGPKELPVVLRTFGQYMTKIRPDGAEFQSSSGSHARSRDAELKQHFDTIQDAAKGIGSLDPASSIGNPIESAAAEKPPADARRPARRECAGAGADDRGDPGSNPIGCRRSESAQPAPASAGEPAVAPGPGPPEAGKGSRHEPGGHRGDQAPLMEHLVDCAPA